MAKNATASLTIVINGKQIEDTFSGLKKEVGKLSRELSNLTPGTEEFQKKVEELRNAQRRFNEIKSEVDNVKKSIEQSLEPVQELQ